jgi:DNA-binding MarR family transcriptional regulator
MAARENDIATRTWLLMSETVLSNVRRQEVSDKTGLSFAKLRVLRRMAKQPMQMGELAVLAGVDPPYLTLIVDDLQSRGLVVRREHPTDRRVKLVSVTDEGMRMALDAESVLARPPQALARLSEGELQTLEGILEKIRHQPG